MTYRATLRRAGVSHDASLYALPPESLYHCHSGGQARIALASHPLLGIARSGGAAGQDQGEKDNSKCAVFHGSPSPWPRVDFSNSLKTESLTVPDISPAKAIGPLKPRAPSLLEPIKTFGVALVFSVSP